LGGGWFYLDISKELCVLFSANACTQSVFFRQHLHAPPVFPSFCRPTAPTCVNAFLRSPLSLPSAAAIQYRLPPPLINTAMELPDSTISSLSRYRFRPLSWPCHRCRPVPIRNAAALDRSYTARAVVSSYLSPGPLVSPSTSHLRRSRSG